MNALMNNSQTFKNKYYLTRRNYCKGFDFWSEFWHQDSLIYALFKYLFT